MKNGKYKLDANQIRQICLGLARGKSFRAISRQTGLSINRVNRTNLRSWSIWTITSCSAEYTPLRHLQ